MRSWTSLLVGCLHGGAPAPTGDSGHGAKSDAVGVAA